MAVITFGNNVSSLFAQRKLADASASTATAAERLSSGLRINQASDDAAGIAISAGLTSAIRVYSQSIRNVSDGISMLNIASGGLSAMQDIVTRLRELSEEAANGAFTSTQRRALQNESDALINEYDRIGSTTNFNGLSLLDGSLGSVGIQVGLGSNVITTDTSSGLTSAVFGGSVGSSTNTGIAAGGAQVADFNGDGKGDIWAVSGTTLTIYTGNGDGSFVAGVTATIPSGSNFVSVDVNNDGKADIVSISAGSYSVSINQAGGGFSSSTSAVSIAQSDSIKSGDFNNDGKADLLIMDAKHTGQTAILLGNGGGGFTQASSFTVPNTGTPADLNFGDFNGDGNIDFLEGKAHQLYFGHGDDTFSGPISLSMINTFGVADPVDLNRDGFSDIIDADAAFNSRLMLSNGDGTFRIAPLFSGTTSFVSSVSDFNNDGILDLLVGDSAGPTMGIRYGNGDGTFGATNQLRYDGFYYGQTADLNGDGVADFLGTNGGSIYTYLASTRQTTTLPLCSLATAGDARRNIDLLAAQSVKLSGVQSSIGASMSRLDVALNNLQSTVVQYQSANSRIMDADVAAESAELVRSQILQQADAAVLAQANQSPALALILLKS